MFKTLGIFLYSQLRRTLFFSPHTLIICFLLLSLARMYYRPPNSQPVISFLWNKRKNLAIRYGIQHVLLYLISLIDRISSFNDVKPLGQLLCGMLEMFNFLVV